MVTEADSLTIVVTLAWNITIHPFSLIATASASTGSSTSATASDVYLAGTWNIGLLEEAVQIA